MTTKRTTKTTTRKPSPNAKSERLDCRTTKKMKRQVERFVKQNSFSNNSEAINFILEQWFNQQQRLTESQDGVVQEFEVVKDTLSDLYEKFDTIQNRYKELLLQRDTLVEEAIEEMISEAAPTLEDDTQTAKSEIQTAQDETAGARDASDDWAVVIKGGKN